MYCHYIGWWIGKCRFIQRYPIFRVSFVRGSTVADAMYTITGLLTAKLRLACNTQVVYQT